MTTAAIDATLATDSPWSAPDGRVLGLWLAMLGVLLIANAALLRNPRSLVEERFEARRLKLTSIRDLVFHRMQMTLGFGYLVAGFIAQLYGHVSPPDEAVQRSSFSLWIGLIVMLGLSSVVVAWWWSTHTFRRHVRDYFVEHPPDFETETALAREVGELFDVETRGDDTVQSYVARLRQVLALPTPRLAHARSRAEDARFPRDPDEGDEPALR